MWNSNVSVFSRKILWNIWIFANFTVKLDKKYRISSKISCKFRIFWIFTEKNSVFAQIRRYSYPKTQKINDFSCSSQYIDEDGDVANEFYQETMSDGEKRRLCRLMKNLRPKVWENRYFLEFFSWKIENFLNFPTKKSIISEIFRARNATQFHDWSTTFRWSFGKFSSLKKHNLE